jgi:hypothetical protein
MGRYAAGQEQPVNSASGRIEPADPSPVLEPREEAKPQDQKDPILTEDEAYDLVWNLPEVKKETQKILDQGGVPVASVAMRPTLVGQEEEKNSFYVIRFQCWHEKTLSVDLLFHVNATNGQVLVNDSLDGGLISLDEWRSRK